MIDREFVFSTYSKNPRPYPRTDAALDQRLTPRLAVLIEQSQRAWLQSDFAYAQSGRRQSHSFSRFFGDFFAHFDIELRAHIYELAANGTTITRELVESLIAGPFPEPTQSTLDRIATFPDDFLYRTCDLGHGWTKQYELNYVPTLVCARFAIVAESGVYLAQYDTRYPRGKRTYSSEAYVVLREGGLRWLDLADDTGEFADLNFVFVQ
ncbi:hypothetical protein FHS27_006577 [Rhodopirellula rubra]|uniref:Uncharacterized protein n=1 Tax=Aporhodopirellula rubra TaxID=980271 RepID=A0A7W5H9S2_9BACT|nr:hypothetical protein [Aporhodopirellula rubra]MBB3210729.1 hypothetical protein [Aporhodopirellula rubra]